jgi:dipeptidyl aminopeptidase/acylaminoacyl peptidase
MLGMQPTFDGHPVSRSCRSPRSHSRLPSSLGVLALALAVVGAPALLRGQSPAPAQPAPVTGPGGATFQFRPPDFEKMAEDQAETDKNWREASVGYMQVDKIHYKSAADGMEIPAWVFQPLKLRGDKGHPALVWVHENIRGHLYNHYIPYIREATAKGYIVIAPEYRGSIGYGKEFYDAIDYGGAEVDDVVTAVDVLKEKYPQVDPSRIGWSHGGMITLLSITRNPTTFKAAVAMVPVTNLFQRLAWKGVERQHRAIDPANRYGGLPAERHEIYKDRSPLYNIDKLQIPLYVGVTRNDEDVNFEEDEQIVDALRSRKPFLATTMIYDNPPGGHTFDRRVDPKTWQPENTREQRDSWNRVWTFLDWNLDPFHTASTSAVSSFHQPQPQG